MDDRLADLLEYILTALEDGKVSVNINTNADNYNEPDEWSTIPMLVCYVDQYLKENHNWLFKEIVSPLAMALNGDILIRTTAKGFEYYKDNKKELYESIHLKSGATNIYLYNVDKDECWVQYEPDLLIKDMGQVPDFGTYSMNQQPASSDQDYGMLDGPLLTIQEMVHAIKEEAPQLTNIKLHAADMVEIIKIIQNRLTMQAYNAIIDIFDEGNIT